MKVLIAVTRYPPDFAGGAERRFHAMALAAQRQGHDVEVLTTNAFATFSSGPVDGIPVRRLDWPRSVDTAGWQAATRIAETMRVETPPDVVWTGNAAMGVGAGRAWPTTSVIYAPGEILPFSLQARLDRAWRRWRTEGRTVAWRWWEREAVVNDVARHACAVALPSAMTVDYVTSARPAAWPAVRVFPRGVDTGHWARARALRRPDAEGRLRILMACRLEALKNIEHCLEALSMCPSSAVRLSICGQGPHEMALRDYAERLGVMERVEFLGMRDDMVSVYAGADVFVMSSNYDLYPNTVSEALATGCPVIMRRPAPPRVMIGIYGAVADCPGCLTYGTDDVAELASRLTGLAQDPARLFAMSRAAAAWAEARDWDRLIGEYLPHVE